MRTVLLFLLILITVAARGMDKTNTEVVQKIGKVENGLIEFKPGPRDNDQKQQLRSLAERMTFYKVPGVSIAVINDYKMEWSKGYGVQQVTSDAPVTTESLFEAASTTKMLVAAVALHFVEKGLIDLDQNVNNYLKSWKIPNNQFTQEQKVTLRRLLTHQSGLNRPDKGLNWEQGKKPSLIQVMMGQAPAKNQAAVVEFIPGSKWQYSNMGYILIQLLLEDISGKSFTKIIKETIFHPLGMKNSTVEHPLLSKYKKRWAIPHDQLGQGHDRPQHPTAIAQGGLVTTPKDLAQFAIELMRAYRGESRRIITSKMAKQMFSKQVDLDPNQFGGIIDAEGMGVFLKKEGKNLYFVHAGHNYPGATSLIMASPVTGKGAVIMTNSAKGDLLQLEILTAVSNVYNWKAE